MATLVIKIKRSFWQRVLFMLLWPWKKFTSWLLKRMLALRAKLQIGSLKEAIGQADDNKEETGRKNMVVFNTTSGKYEPIQKKLLKKAASAKQQPPTRNGFRVPKAVKKTKITKERVKQIEEKSLYVTK
jgi:hypothetical protein